MEPATPAGEVAHHLDRDEFARLGVKAMSFVKMAEKFGCSESTVAQCAYG
jgi:uncharacterized protein YjcR